MTTSYPTAIDSFSNPLSSDKQNSATVPHSAQHQNANDAIEAIEAVLGIKPNGSSVSVATRLSTIEANITALGATATGALQDGSVTTNKLGSQAVTTVKIADDSITAAKLQTDSVTTAKISNSSVTLAKLSSDIRVPVLCTSSTRPGSPAIGQQIYESDTYKLLQWNGSAWRQPWNMPWGIQGIGSAAVDQGSIVGSVVDITSLTITFTAVANRRYRIYLEANMYSSVPGDVAQLLITTSANSIIQWGHFTCLGAGTPNKGVCSLIITPTAGSVTYKARVQRSAGSGNISIQSSGGTPSYLIIEDIGPNGAAA